MRGPPFVEGQYALVPVLCRDCAIIGLDLEGQTVAQGHLQSAVDRLLGLADRDRSIGRNPLGCRHGFREQGSCREHGVDQTPILGLNGGKGASGQDQFLGAPLAYGPGDGLGPAAAGRMPSVTSVKAKRA